MSVQRHSRPCFLSTVTRSSLSTQDKLRDAGTGAARSAFRQNEQQLYDRDNGISRSLSCLETSLRSLGRFIVNLLLMRLAVLEEIGRLDDIVLSDYVQHKHARAVQMRNTLIRRWIRYFGSLRCGALVGCTTDTWMNFKPQIIFLQDILDRHFGTGTKRVSVLRS